MSAARVFATGNYPINRALLFFSVAGFVNASFLLTFYNLVQRTSNSFNEMVHIGWRTDLPHFSCVSFMLFALYGKGQVQ